MNFDHTRLSKKTSQHACIISFPRSLSPIFFRFQGFYDFDPVDSLLFLALAVFLKKNLASVLASVGVIEGFWEIGGLGVGGG